MTSFDYKKKDIKAKKLLIIEYFKIKYNYNIYLIPKFYLLSLITDNIYQ